MICNTQTKTTGASSEQYTYDGFNRLVKVVNAAGTTTYDYRPDGLRNSKTVAGVKTAHIWDGQNMSAELNASGAILRAYIRGVGLIAEDDAAGTRQYALYNAHGDVVQLSNTNGVVTREYQYDAFGNERNPDAADTNPFRYCGEYFDAETGDIYLRARYYDPAAGRFTQMDSVWSTSHTIPNGQTAIDPLSLNLYTYCYNNPLSYIDPTGNVSEELAAQRIKNNASNIILAGEEFGVNPAILAATIYAEQVKNVTYTEGGEDFIQSVLNMNCSVGLAQVRISTAKKVEDAGYISKTYEIRIKTYVLTNPFTGEKMYHTHVISRESNIYTNLTDDKTNIRYAAAYLAYIQDLWKSSYPEIDGRTAILATLYNIGEAGSIGVHKNPKSNSFGDYAKDNYHYMKELLGLT